MKDSLIRIANAKVCVFTEMSFYLREVKDNEYRAVMTGLRILMDNGCIKFWERAEQYTLDDLAAACLHMQPHLSGIDVINQIIQEKRYYEKNPQLKELRAKEKNNLKI